jgi:hypothetical protein
MHPQVILIVAQQRIADLYRAADRDRVVHTATIATSSHAVPALRHAAAAAAPVSFLRWLRRRLPPSRIPVHGRLEPREDQAGDCK